MKEESKYYTPTIEIWKDAIGYEEEYEVSNLGNVRRKQKNLIQKISPNGYYTLSLSKEGTCKTELVHRLVAKAFIENDGNKEQVNHKDCDKLNNKLINLEWVTHEENMKHSVENGRQRDQSGENNSRVKLTEKDILFIRKLKVDGYTTYKIHKEFYPYLHQQTIYAIIIRRLWKHI